MARKKPLKQSDGIDTNDGEAEDSENVNEMDSVEDNLYIGKLVEECFGCENNSIGSLENKNNSSGKKTGVLSVALRLKAGYFITAICKDDLIS